MKKMLKVFLIMIFAVCMLAFAVHAADGVVMTVNGTKYTDHATGWSEAIELADDNIEVTVKLFADWIADREEGFECPDGGSRRGALYVDEDGITLDLNGYTIDRNADQDASSYASSVFFVDHCEFTIDDTSEAKSGKITGGYNDRGGAFFVDNSILTINGGSICGNKANNGGAIYLNRDSWEPSVIFNDGFIENNYVTNRGGAVYLGADTAFTMNGGIIRNNTAKDSGGAIFTFEFHSLQEDYQTSQSKVYINGGIISGNVAENGWGGAIYWDQYSKLYLSNCTITGNSTPKRTGGGIYVANSGPVLMLSGTVNITGNTGFTNRSDNENNIQCKIICLLLDDSDTKDRFSPDSKIGLSFDRYYPDEKEVLNKSPGTWGESYSPELFSLTKEMVDSFFMDDPYYTIVGEKRADDGYYDIYYIETPDFVVSDPLLTVETKEGVKKGFNSYNRGWIYALEQSENTDVTVTLYRDWNGYLGNYKCTTELEKEFGTSNGRLYIPSSCKHNITIDLNGYSIDRGLTSAVSNGSVFHVNTEGSLTIIDSSEAKTGKITGGNSTGNGGAFYVDYGTLYLKGVTVTGNYAEYGGGIYCDDLDDAIVYIQDGTKIYDNTVSVSGGGIYMYNGYLYLEDGEIKDNDAANGAGIYWNSDNACYLTGGEIKGNHASDKCGGVYVSTNGDIYLGGDVQVTDNYDGNLYLSGSSANISNACGQDGAPDKPLADGAKIGITSSKIEEEISTSDSKFDEGDFRYMYSDVDRYFIRSVYDENSDDYPYKLYFNTWGHADARYPRVKSVSVKDSNLLADAILDYDTQTITLVAYNTRKNFFERAALSDLVECTYDKDIYYLYQMDYMRDLRDPQEYKIMSDNGTYVICKVNVVPEGGKWADVQESMDTPYKMVVKMGIISKGFNDFGEGWTYAVSQSNPVTVTLFADWNAIDGEFDYSEGTSGGRLYIDGKDITIDLNGNTINRGLTEETSNGHVFRLAGGAVLTITDTSDEGNGKITGGYSSGNGGAFYIDYGKLYINGGEISGNKADNGGAIYSTNEDDSFVYINGGKITGNTAEDDGGAIYMEEGFLYVNGGEISENYATNNGGGIYWNSENKICLTGGKIINNTSYHGAGVYVTDWGDIYLGGNIVIKDNLTTTRVVFYDLFLSDTDVLLNHAVGQDSEVPNKPFTEGACVRITTNDESGYCISGSDSRFYMDSIQYLKASTVFEYVRAAYDANGGNHKYKIYYIDNNGRDKEPQFQTITPKSEIVSQTLLDTDLHEITIIADLKAKELGTLENANLSSLIDVTFNMEGVQIVDFDSSRDFTKPQKFMIMRSDNVYFIYTVKVEWACVQHEDADKNHVCDYCEEYILTDLAIAKYDEINMEAVVITPEAGTYTIMFVDYDGTRLENIDVVEYEFKEGVNTVSQENVSFALGSGDKIMLWYDMVDLVPVCEALTLK